MRLNLPYLRCDTDRHGNERLFVRRFGRCIRIRALPGTKGFGEAYSAALEALEAGAPQVHAPRGAAPAGTLGWLAATYFAAVEFTGLPTVSQSTRRGIIEACLREPIKPNSPDKLALCPLSLLSAAHIRMLRDRRADKPGAANNRLKYVGSMLSWAVERNLIRANPARDVKPLRYQSDGFHTWSPSEVRQFEERHPIGTKARLALALMLYLGVRRSDAVTPKEAAESERAKRARDRLTLRALIDDWHRLHLAGRRPRYAKEAVRALHCAFADALDDAAEDLDR